MAHYYSAFDPATGLGRVYLRPLANAASTEIVNELSLNSRPCLLKYRDRVHNIGQFSRVRIYTEYGTEHLGGILAPTTPPVLAAGSSSGGSTGAMFGVIVFRQRIGNKIIQQSNPSAISNLVSLTGQGRVWSGIQATSPDAHVTHVAGLLSISGSVPAEAWERPIGATTVTENQLGTQLLSGEFHVLPSYNSAIDNQISTDPNARGVPPYCKYAVIYHDAMLYGGDPMHPDRIYPSKSFEMTSVNSADRIVDVPSGYLETQNGDAVLGLAVHGDEAIVGTPGGFYAVQGYGAGDYSIRKINSFYGLLNHFTMVPCGPNSDLWAASQEGVVMYNGGFRHLMKNWASFWRQEYQDHQDNYENAYAAEDRWFGGYKLRIPQDDETSLYFYGHYDSVAEGGQPWWVIDRRNRNDSAFVELGDQEDARHKRLATGSCDGFVRYENVEADGDDDGDTYQKAMTVAFKHKYAGDDQGGDDSQGATWGPIVGFVKNPTKDVAVSLYAGDDDAYEATTPQQTKTLKAQNVPTGQRAALTGTSRQIDISEVSGKGLTVKMSVTAPVNVRVRGYSVLWRKGPQGRPFA